MGKFSILSSRPFLNIYMRKSCMTLFMSFGVNITISIIKLILLTVKNVSRVENIFVMVIVICGIKILFIVHQMFLVFYLIE